ncbi:hypothetical protein [Enterobacter hormaechei]
MKFAIFDNLNGTTNVSLNRKIVKTNEMTNNRNSLKNFIKSFNIHRNLQAKLLSKIENALTVKNIRSFEIGMSELNDKPAIVAYAKDLSKAVIVCCEGRNWKALGSDLTMIKANDKQEFIQQYVGDFVEIKEEIEFPTEQKVDVLANEMEELRKEIEALKQKNAELSKENSAFRKNIKGEKLSFDEELIIAMIEIESEAATSEIVTPISNESSVFIVSNTEENSNEPLIVSDDQLTDQNENEMTDKQFIELLKEENRMITFKLEQKEQAYDQLEKKFYETFKLLEKAILNNSISKTN